MTGSEPRSGRDRKYSPNRPKHRPVPKSVLAIDSDRGGPALFTGARTLDKDAEAPQLPPSYWAGASIGKYYRPLKTQISLRIDNEVLDWLKSNGEGHLSRINEILRERMVRER